MMLVTGHLQTCSQTDANTVLYPSQKKGFSFFLQMSLASHPPLTPIIASRAILRFVAGTSPNSPCEGPTSTP